MFAHSLPKTLTQLLAILAFVLAGAQFSHAHEFDVTTTTESMHIHTHAMDAHGHSIDVAETEPTGSMHCGAHLLPLVAEYVLASHTAEPDYTRLLQIFVLKDHASFDTPPPRV